MNASAESVLREARENPSYGAPFGLYEQTPMKTFMGHTPCVPYPVVVDALSRSQRMQDANPKADNAEIRKAIGIDVASCAAMCMPELAECFAKYKDGDLATKMAKPEMQACVSKAQACQQSCIAAKK